MNRYFQLVSTLYSLGARSFLILEVPPLWLTPQLQAENATAQASMRSAVDSYNSLLESAAHSFHLQYPNVTLWQLNTAKTFEMALDDPEAYGAPDATCYNSDGVNCLWWNDFHPGAAIHNLVAQAIAAQIGISMTIYMASFG